MSEWQPSLIVVSAPSGAGKSTVLARVLAEVAQLRFSVSHTTRAPRAGERSGVEYHFVSREAFQALIAGEAMLEWASVHEQLYGTSRAELEAARSEGKDLLLDLDVQGAAQVRRRFPDVVTIFILPPSYEELERRLRSRAQDSEAAIRRRLENARAEVGLYREYDHVIVNDSLEACVAGVQCVIQAARCRVSRVEARALRILRTFEALTEEQ